MGDERVKAIFDEILENHPRLAEAIATRYDDYGAYEFEVQLESLVG